VRRIVPASREGTLQHKPIAKSYSRASQVFFDCPIRGMAGSLLACRRIRARTF